MLLDLIYVALFAVAFPLWDALVAWPAFRRQSQVDPAGARKRLWTGAGFCHCGAVGERPKLGVARIFRTARLAVVDLHCPVPAHRGLLRLRNRDRRPQCRSAGKHSAARSPHHPHAAHAGRTVSMEWCRADRRVLRGISISRLLHRCVRTVARLVGAPQPCPSRSSRPCTRSWISAAASWRGWHCERETRLGSRNGTIPIAAERPLLPRPGTVPATGVR